MIFKSHGTHIWNIFSSLGGGDDPNHPNFNKILNYD